MASREHTVVLVSIVGDVLAGRALPDKVSIGGVDCLATTFLSGLRSADLGDMRKALDLPDHMPPDEVAKAYGARRGAPKVDPSRPYLDEAGVCTIEDSRGPPILLARLATALRYGGPCVARVRFVEGRGVRAVTLREALREMESDRVDRAEQAARTLGIDAVRVGDVARVVAGRLEQAGVIEAPKPKARRPVHV